ncbi:MAG: hypothetical protein HKN16_08685 [Saprospiraceae bacterium]|nr:hypothetical protein [Saprospiraceae bacterium]
MRFLSFLLIIGSSCLIACNSKQVTEDPFEHISDVKAKNLLKQALKGSGGLDNWISLDKLTFQKQYRLYLESGEVETSADQRHSYSLQGERKGTISWKDGSEDHRINFSKDKMEKLLAGQRDTSWSETRIENTVLSSVFVMMIPYNLLDPTASLSYAGEEMFNGKLVEVLQVEYDPDQHENHTTPDIWWLLFSKDNYALLGYKVKHKDHISLVENLQNKKIQGILLPEGRKSWRVDEQGNKLYLRADYSYSYIE